MMKGAIFVLVGLLVFSVVVSAQTFDFVLGFNTYYGYINAGESSSFKATASLFSGTAQSVIFSCPSLPEGLKCSLSPSSCSTLPCTSVVTVSTTSALKESVYSITMSATSGGKTHTSPYTLTVSAPKISSSIISNKTSTIITPIDSFPKVSITSDKTKLNVGESFTLTVTGYDDVRLAKISWKGNNTPDPSFNYENPKDCTGSTCTLTNGFKPQKAGTYNFIGRAVDSKSQESTQKVSITVVDIVSGTQSPTTSNTTQTTSVVSSNQTTSTTSTSSDSPPKLSVSVDKEITTEGQATIFAKASDDKGLLSITIRGENTPDSYYNDETVEDCYKKTSCSTEMDITTEETGTFSFKIIVEDVSGQKSTEYVKLSVVKPKEAGIEEEPELEDKIYDEENVKEIQQLASCKEGQVARCEKSIWNIFNLDSYCSKTCQQFTEVKCTPGKVVCSKEGFYILCENDGRWTTQKTEGFENYCELEAVLEKTDQLAKPKEASKGFLDSIFGSLFSLFSRVKQESQEQLPENNESTEAEQPEDVEELNETEQHEEVDEAAEIEQSSITQGNTCQSTDADNSPLVRGTTTGIANNPIADINNTVILTNQYGVFADKCLANGNIMEYYCYTGSDGISRAGVSYPTCEYGCDNGACRTS